MIVKFVVLFLISFAILIIFPVHEFFMIFGRSEIHVVLELAVDDKVVPEVEDGLDCRPKIIH